MKLEKNSDTRRYRVKGGAEKYYIQCSPEKLKEADFIHVNKERAIVKALLKDGVVRTNAHVVVKIGESATIQKEWEIGSKIQKTIPGFMKYICKLECHDNIDQYSSRPKNICTNNADDPMMHVLVMPYISGGSMREYDWENRGDKFKSCLKQLICSLVTAFEKYGFLHTDIHLGNVLVRETKKTEIVYADLNVTIPTYGVQICIMDFEHAFIGVDRKYTSEFYKDMNHALSDIIHTLKLQFDGFDQIYRYVVSGMFMTDRPVRDILRLLLLIDHMEYRGKSKPFMSLEYDPNGF